MRLAEFFDHVAEDNSAALDLCFVLCKAVDLSVCPLRDIDLLVLVVLLPDRYDILRKRQVKSRRFLLLIRSLFFACRSLFSC